MKSLASVFLLISILPLLGSSCHRLNNTVASVRMICGADAEADVAYTRILNPDGTELGSNEVEAAMWDEGRQRPQTTLQFTQKNCLPRTDATVLIRSKKSSSRLAWLGPLTEAETPLALENNNITLDCSLSPYMGFVYKPQLNSVGTFGFRGFRVTLDDQTGKLPLTLQAQSLDFDLKDFSEGKHQLTLTAENVFSQEKQTKICEVQIDRTPPVVTFDPEHRVVDRQRVPPGFVVTFANSEPATTNVCVRAPAAASPCENIKLNDNSYMMPAYGSWTLQYYSVDSAGNRSDLQAIPFAIYNQSQIQTIDAQIKLAGFHEQAFAQLQAARDVLDAHRLRDELHTPEEFSAVDTKLQEAYWRLGFGLHARNEWTISFDRHTVDACASRVALYTSDGTIQIFDSSGRVEQRLNSVPFAPETVMPGILRWGADGRILVSASGRGEVQLWTGTTLPISLGGADAWPWINVIEVSDDSSFIAVVGAGKLSIFSRDGREIGSWIAVVGDLGFIPGTHRLVVSMDKDIRSIDMDSLTSQFENIASGIQRANYVLPIHQDLLVYGSGKEVHVIPKGEAETVFTMETSLDARPLYLPPTPQADGSVHGPSLLIPLYDGSVWHCSFTERTCAKRREARFPRPVMTISDQNLIVSSANAIEYRDKDNDRGLTEQGLWAPSFNRFPVNVEIKKLWTTAQSVVASGAGKLFFLAKGDRFHYFETYANRFHLPQLTRDKDFFVSSLGSTMTYAPAAGDLSKTITKTFLEADHPLFFIRELTSAGGKLLCLLMGRSPTAFTLCDDAKSHVSKSGVIEKGDDGLSFITLEDNMFKLYSVDDPMTAKVAVPRIGNVRLRAARDYMLLKNDQGYHVHPAGNPAYALPIKPKDDQIYLFDSFLMAEQENESGTFLIKAATGELIHYPDLIMWSVVKGDRYGQQMLLQHRENARELHIFDGPQPVARLQTGLKSSDGGMRFLDGNYLTHFVVYHGEESLSEVYNIKNQELIFKLPASYHDSQFFTGKDGLFFFEKTRILKLSFAQQKLRQQLCEFVQSALNADEKKNLCP